MDAPTGDQLPFTQSELQTISPVDIAFWSPQGWIPDGQNQLVGNNVEVRLDVNGDNIADAPPLTGLPYRVFDFPSTHPDQDPSSYPEASMVQLFFLCNAVVNDWLASSYGRL